VQDNFWLNTRAQTQTFSLENKRDLAEMIDALKDREIEFVFFDVFRSLWAGNENDNMEVAKVPATLNRIQGEVGCSLALIHHLNKSDGVNIFSKLRGGSAIRGWQEWGFGIVIPNAEEPEGEWVRSIKFETKAGPPHPGIHYRIAGPPASTRLELIPHWRPSTKRRATVDDILNPTQSHYQQ